MSSTDDPTATPQDHAFNSEDHRRRMRFQWRDLMEDLIEDGHRRGLFDDLPGRGRPLDLEKNIYEGSNTLANRLMKDNDILPAWISNRLDLSEKVKDLRVDISRSWQRYRAGFAQAQGDAHRSALTIGWDESCRRWQTTIDKLNSEIESYNLKRPRGQLELFKLRLDDELKRVDAPRYLL